MDIYVFVMIIVLGLIIGSFLNCLIWRLYRDEGLGGRSYCPHCHKGIAWYDNIPLLSFLILGGRCRHCQSQISWQYPLVEISTAILFLWSFQVDMSSPQLLWLLIRDWLLIITLIIIFVYDFRWQLVPVSMVGLMGLIILVLNCLLGYNFFVVLFFALLGALFFIVQYFATKKRGVGEGDIWLGAFLGAAFPDAGKLLLILLISYGFGAIVGLILVGRQQKKWQSRMALGPFLALGAIITLIWGKFLIGWYLGLFI